MPFDLSDISHMSRNHAIALFSHAIPVIAKQGETYIVNNLTLFNQYQKNKKSVRLFTDLVTDENALSKVGFI